MDAYDVFLQLGIWGACGLLGLIFKFVWTMARQMKELWEVHLGAGSYDEDRRPRWYFPSILNDNIADLATAITSLKEVLIELHRDTQEIQEDQKVMKHDQADIKRTLHDVEQKLDD